MLKVHFDPIRGYSVPDGLIESFVNDVIETRNPQAGDYELTVGSDTLVTQFRLAVAKKKIPHTDLVFVYDNKEIPVDERGSPRFWPAGFADQTMDALIQLCRA